MDTIWCSIGSLRESRIHGIGQLLSMRRARFEVLSIKSGRLMTSDSSLIDMRVRAARFAVLGTLHDAIPDGIDSSRSGCSRSVSRIAGPCLSLGGGGAALLGPCRRLAVGTGSPLGRRGCAPKRPVARDDSLRSAGRCPRMEGALQHARGIRLVHPRAPRGARGIRPKIRGGGE